MYVSMYVDYIIGLEGVYLSHCSVKNSFIFRTTTRQARS